MYMLSFGIHNASTSDIFAYKSMEDLTSSRYSL